MRRFVVLDRTMIAKSSPLSTQLPSPVRRLAVSATGEAELWLKDDSSIGTLYGGNKVRKLQAILPHARARGAKRLVTVGAAGSHHVLATSLLGSALGFPVLALLLPQPLSPHVLENLKVGLAAGLQTYPVASLAGVPLALARQLRPGDYLIPAGGSGPIGSTAYYRAAGELAGQVDSGLLPSPDVIVLPFGSGGTAAGLLAGLVASGMSTRLCAVDVALGGRSARLPGLLQRDAPQDRDRVLDGRLADVQAVRSVGDGGGTLGVGANRDAGHAEHGRLLLNPARVGEDEPEVVSGGRGARVVLRPGDAPEVSVLATGSEVSLAVAAAEQLSEEGRAVQVVSVPCVEWMTELPAAEREALLGLDRAHRVAVEAGRGDAWYRWAAQVVSIEEFGESGSGAEVMAARGMTVEAVTAAVRRVLA